MSNMIIYRTLSQALIVMILSPCRPITSFNTNISPGGMLHGINCIFPGSGISDLIAERKVFRSYETIYFVGKILLYALNKCLSMCFWFSTPIQNSSKIIDLLSFHNLTKVLVMSNFSRHIIKLKL